MENQKNSKGVIALLIILVIILSILCVLFATGAISFSERELNYDNQNNKNVSTTSFNYSDYVSVMKNSNPSAEYGVYNQFGYVSSFYLVDGMVYYDLYLDGVNNSKYANIVNKLKKSNVKIPKYDDNMNIVEYVNLEKYEANLNDIINIQTYNYSQDGSKIVFFISSKGEVYYFSTSNKGSLEYPLFNEKSEINIKKSNLNNIINFFSYDSICYGNLSCSGTQDIYAVDINGNLNKFNFQ